MVHLDIQDEGQFRCVELPEGRHVFGRAADADIRLESPMVSRQHAVIEVRNGEVWVEDLGSMWGTFVGARRLEHGEREQFAAGEVLRLARVQMWSHGLPQPEPAYDPEITDKDGLVVTGFGSPQRTLPMLRHLFEIFSAEEGGHAIEREACLFVKNWIRADRVCLFEASEAGVAPTLRSFWSQREVDPDQLMISRAVVNRVLATGQPARWMRGDEQLDPEDSRQRYDIQAAVAVPLQGPLSIRGVIYADRRSFGLPYTDEDVEILTATASAVAMRRAVSQNQIETRKAARIQQSMLPVELPSCSGFQLEAGLHMCHGVGGDLYDLICRPEEHCLLCVGDVSGKGLPAALIMGATSYLVRALADLQLSPLEIYKRVHANLLAKYQMRQYVALFLGELDHRTGTLNAVVAGVPRPLVIRTSGDVEELPVTAFAAALIDIDDPPPTQVSIALDPGDLLAVFTDGYPEATPDGDHFLESAVVDQLVRDRALPLPEIRARLDRTVDEFVGSSGPSDDRTLLLVRRD